MANDKMPVIRREWTAEDSNAHILNTVRDDTRFHRGLGRTGEKVEHVEHDCPHCGNRETIRSVHVNPEMGDDVAYWCLRPTCLYFVGGELSWATEPHHAHQPEYPFEWEQTVVCPSCEERHVTTVRKHSDLHTEIKHADGLVEHHCEECRANVEASA